MSGIIGSPIIAGVSSKKLDSTAIAPTYSNTATYAIGAHITRNGVLYECIDPIVSAEEWDPSKWKAVNVVDETVHAVAPGSSIGAIEVSTEQKKEDVVVNGLGPVDPTTSGTIASFDDGADGIPVKSLKVDIEPVQDLNGYANPWPPGGGKNLNPWSGVDFTTETHSTGIWLQAGSYVLSTDNGAPFGANHTIYIKLTNSSGDIITPNNISGQGWALSSTGQYYYGYGSTVLSRAPFELLTDCYFFFGFNVEAPDNVNAIQLEAGSIATAYEPYSNICPITGWTGAKVTRSGKNLLDLNRSAGIPTPTEANNSASPRIMDTAHYYIGVSPNNYYHPYDVLNVNVSSNAISFISKSSFYGLAFPVSVKGGLQYIASGNLEYCNFAFGFYDKNWNYLSYSTRNPVMTPAECSYMTVCIAPTGSVSNELTCTCTNIQLEIGSTATAYAPYQGDTYDISFPDEAGTVYDGTLDVTNGVLTVDRAMKVFSGASSEGWYKSEYGYFVTPRISDAINHDAKKSDFQSNLFAYGYIANGNTDLGGCLIWGCVRVRLADMSISLDEWKAQLASTPMQVVYPLANPIEITLTPTQIATLLGVNNIWADTGDVEVTYRSDQLKFAPVDSPAFTGTPIVPTAEAGTNNGQAASTAFVQKAVESSASETLETAKDYTDEVFGEHSIVRSVTTGDIDGSVSVDTDGAEADVLVKGLGPVIKTATGELVSLDDGAEDIPVKALTVAVEPVQDLNGYDAPWPPGGGKNLLPNTATTQTALGVTFTVNDDGSITANGTSTGRATINVAQFALPAGDYIYSQGFAGNANGAVSYLKLGTGSGAVYIDLVNELEENFSLDTETEVYCTCEIRVAGYYADNNTFYPMIRLATETDDTYEPYSNICPISGWTGAKVQRAGKNLLENTVDTVTNHGITYTKGSDGSISYTGTSDGAHPYYSGMGAMSYANTIRLPAGEYVASSGSANVATLVRKVYADESYELIASTSTVNFTLPEASNIWITFHLRPVTSGTAYSGIFYPQLEVGSTATDYEPYQGNSYTIDWTDEAGTVYGGTLDVTSGVLTVDRTTVVAKNLTWVFYPSEYYSYTTVNDKITASIGSADYPVKCSILPYGGVTYSQYFDNYKIYQSANKALYVKDLAVNSLTEFEDKYGDAQITYYLATPITYQLTPTEVTTLLGVNNIYADTGDIDITYRTNISKYAPIDSPVFTGEPLTPTPDEDSNNNQVASTAFVKKAINANSVTSVDTGTVDGTVSVVKDGVASDVVVKGLEDTVKVESGEFVSLDDGAEDIPVKSLVVDIEPVQNLNGYDAPWPPGGGKNLASSVFVGSDPNIYVGTLFAEAELEPNTTYTLSFIAISGRRYYVNENLFANYGTVTGTSGRVSVTITTRAELSRDNLAQYIANQGWMVLKNDQNFDSPNTFTDVMLEAGSIATAYEPYSNICPITGWTGAKVTRSGKNLVNLPDGTVGTNESGVANGAPIPWKIPIEQAWRNIELTWSFELESTVSPFYVGNAKIFFWDADGAVIAIAEGISTRNPVAGQKFSVSFNVAEGAETFTLGFYLATTGVKTEFTVTNPQLEIGSTATAYEPYQGNTYDISFPDEAGTVYGGTLDVTTGVLTVDRAKIQLNSLSYSKDESTATNARFRSSIAGIKAPTDNYTTVNAICATYPAGPWYWLDEPGHNIFFAARQFDDVAQFIVRNAAYATTAEFVASLSDADVLVYELATPVTYQLTPTEVNTLLGVNNIYADTGEIEVAYRTGLPGFTPTDSPVFTGIPLSPTAPERSDNSQVANTNYVQGAVYESVAGIYTFGGRDLSTVFGSADNLHAAIEAGDFRKINIGDYWPITLSGTFVDAATGTTKTLSNAVFKMEVAAINPYYRFGDTAISANHVAFVSRDLMPMTLQMRSEDSTWYDTTAVNPWLGSAMYTTLNNATDGVIKLVEGTDIGAYIYAGPNGKGMRYMAESMAAGASAPTGWAWSDRGKLFLLSEREIYGSPAWQANGYAGGILYNQYPIFSGSGTHIIKGLGNGGSRCDWWLAGATSAAHFCRVSGYGYAANTGAAYTTLSVPLCFLMV